MAMPGAIPAIWCDIRGMPKRDQRGLVQPFIAIMQLFALALLLERHGLTSKVAIDVAISLPAPFTGSVLAFRRRPRPSTVPLVLPAERAASLA
jgi:uncharacterized protein